MKKQSIAIIGVIAFVLAVVVGYALFSDNLTVSGSATATGVGEITKVGYTAVDATEIAKISEDKNTLTVTVNKLDYPGAYVTIPVTITNKGSVSAKLKNINETGLTQDNRAIKVTYTGVAASDTVIKTNDTQEMNIKVEWDPSINTGSSDVTFQITLEYEQAK